LECEEHTQRKMTALAW